MRALLLSRSISLTILLFAVHVVNAQTYFYISTISVSPAEPTENDAITISLTGDLSSTGSFVVSAEYMLMSNIVHITVTAADNGGLSVLVPHTEEVSIGTLPEGSYGILVDGTAIDDSAPEFQHSFNVSGGGPSCDDLDPISVQWGMFSDTAITVHVTNAASGGFDYPGFILFDANGDTLAMETTNLFGISIDSWHTLSIHPDAEIPSGEFTGRLELWTGFYDVLACTWDQSFDLCPAAECVTVHPYMNNFGDGLVEGSFSWTVNDEDGTVASGVFELTGEIQSGIADACLTPGSYELVVTPLQGPGGGQLVMGVGGEAWSDDVQQPLLQGIPTAPLSFEVVPGCFDGTNGIAPQESSLPLYGIRIEASGIDVRSSDGKALGPIEVRDALGRLVHTANTAHDRLHIELNAFGPYMLRARNSAMKFVAGGR